MGTTFRETLSTQVDLRAAVLLLQDGLEGHDAVCSGRRSGDLGKETGFEHLLLKSACGDGSTSTTSVFSCCDRQGERERVQFCTFYQVARGWFLAVELVLPALLDPEAPEHGGTRICRLVCFEKPLAVNRWQPALR